MLCCPDIAQAAKKLRKMSKMVHITSWNSIRIKMHDIISNIAHAIKVFAECWAIYAKAKFFPTVGIFKESDVFSERKVCNRLDLALMIARISCLLDFVDGKFCRNEVSDVIFDLSE